jgi:alkanesulfonate monooxygenase SsuD/methylene tetrahydromethanopterin reductase-like flavin-dependent oxidoreductase (luciferase family)
MLERSGEIADGSILSVAAGVDYIRWARERIDTGRQRASRSDRHELTVFAIFAVDDDAQAARAAARRTLAFYKAAGGRNALTDAEGISDDLESMVARGGAAEVERSMPDEWVEKLTIAGSPEEVVEKIRRLQAAGADSVALFPADADRVDEIIARTKSDVIPAL